jgi:hypothetical protein
MPNKLLVPFISDIAFGLLLLSAIVTYAVTGFNWLIGGYTIGVTLSYAVHVGSHMFGYSVNAKFTDD